MVLPTGTITFLFTDIEGSTKLWEAQPDRMGMSLARHDQLLRKIIEQNDGYVFKTVGDAFCAAFHTAGDAVRASLDSQIALKHEPWEGGVPLRVRMAVHTGAAEVRDNDYFGQALNRIARLLSTGHGEQVLLSEITHGLCRDALPEGVSLKLLGEHRLKDLTRPESIYQLLHPNIRSEFPALKSLETVPNNLPNQLTSFIGREKDIEAVKTLFGKGRFVTLTGPGGAGKTRLALQVAADLVDSFADGAWFVDLSSLTEPSLVASTIASTFKLSDDQSAPIQDKICDHLLAKHVLLILDNCEHLLAVTAALANHLLRQCPNLSLLCTSRSPLGISGEQTYRVPSLSVPEKASLSTPESVGHYEAARLFIDRAVMQSPSFAITNESAPYLAAICNRLDGIPLAIELAAARIRSMSLKELNERLDHRFRILTGGSKSALPRQQTLRSLIDWSYELLTDSEKSLLVRLSVFSGGWTLNAAERVCDGEPIECWEVLDGLTSLYDKSLVVAEERGDKMRYRMLETVKEYARDRLKDTGQTDRWNGRHLTHYAELSIEAREHLGGPEQAIWLDSLENEMDNLRAAVVWAASDERLTEKGLTVASSSWRFLEIRGHATEGRKWLTSFLAVGGAEVQADTRARAEAAAGNLATAQGDLPAASAFHQKSLESYRQLEDTTGIAYALLNLGDDAWRMGDFDSGKSLLQESLTMFRGDGNEDGACRVLVNLGTLAYESGDFDDAGQIFEECLHLKNKLGDLEGTAATVNNLANIAYVRKDWQRARQYYRESEAIYREIGHHEGVAISINNQAGVAFGEGDLDLAENLVRKALEIRSKLGNARGLVESIEGLAMITGAKGASDRAMKLWGAASGIRERCGYKVPPREQAEHEQELSSLRIRIEDHRLCEAIWSAGRDLTQEQAIELAMNSGD